MRFHVHPQFGYLCLQVVYLLAVNDALNIPLL
jgi:hypothetical protein